MEIESTVDKGKVVFLRLPQEVYEQLEKLRAEAGKRGVATIATMIIETALKEGVTVAKEAPKKNGRSKRAA